MDDQNVPTPPSGEEETNTEENATNILLTPDGQAVEMDDEPTLRALINMGAIRQVNPAIRKDTDKPMVFDFIKHFYPKDPDGAKRYFDAEAESRKNDI